jgi:hypothetical protein
MQDPNQYSNSLFDLLNLGEVGEQLKGAAKTYNALRAEIEINLIAPFKKFLEDAQDSIQPVVDFIRKIQALAPEERAAFAELFADAYTHWKGSYFEEQDKVAGVLARRSWPRVERYLSSSEMQEALELQSDSDFDSYVVQIFSRSDHEPLRCVMKSWRSVPYLANRTSIIDEALQAHISRLYGLSIPALLPFIEGIAAELIQPTTKRPRENIVKQVVTLHVRDESTWSQVLADTVCDVVYKNYAFEKDASPLFNRHGILHGRVSDYNTAANSLRVFLLIDAMVGIYTLTKARTLSSGQ